MLVISKIHHRNARSVRMAPAPPRGTPTPLNWVWNHGSYRKQANMSPAPAHEVPFRSYLHRNPRRSQFSFYIFKFFPMPTTNVESDTSFEKFHYLRLDLRRDVYTSKSPRLHVHVPKSLHPRIIQTEKPYRKLITTIINQSEGFILSFCIATS